MNAKRQTIWLVSMLSLMVVLSAYYLFTEDVDKLNKASDNAQTDQIKVDTIQADPGTQAKTDPAAAGKASDTKAGDSKAADSAKTDAKAPDAKAPDAVKTDAKVADQNNQALTEAEVLKKLEAQGLSASDYFAVEQLKRSDALTKKTGQLLTIITDQKTGTEALTKAYADLQKIQDQETKQMNIEEALMKNYNQAVLLEDGNKWKVVVQSDKLEKSQAVSIIDLVTTELNVEPTKVYVELKHS